MPPNQIFERSTKSPIHKHRKKDSSPMRHPFSIDNILKHKGQKKSRSSSLKSSPVVESRLSAFTSLGSLNQLKSQTSLSIEDFKAYYNQLRSVPAYSSSNTSTNSSLSNLAGSVEKRLQIFNQEYEIKRPVPCYQKVQLVDSNLSDEEVEIDVTSVETPEPKKPQDFESTACNKKLETYTRFLAFLMELVHANIFLAYSPDFLAIKQTTEAYIEEERINASITACLGAKLRPAVVPIRVTGQVAVENSSRVADLLGSVRSLIESNQCLVSTSMLNILNLVNQQTNGQEGFSYNLHSNYEQTNSNYPTYSTYSYNDSQAQSQQVQASSNGYNPNQPDANFVFPTLANQSLTTSGESLYGSSQIENNAQFLVSNHSYQPFLQPPSFNSHQGYETNEISNSFDFQNSNPPSISSIQIQHPLRLPDTFHRKSPQMSQMAKHNASPAQVQSRYVLPDCEPSTSRDSGNSDLSDLARSVSPGEELYAEDSDVEEITNRCQWRGCTYITIFHDTHALANHVKVDHTDHQSNNCCFWAGCEREEPFKANYQLDLHMRKHTKFKPHACEEDKKCKKRYSRVENLKTHIRTHTGDKPFPCSLCGKRFTNASDRAKHQTRTHSNEKPYECPVRARTADCGKKYTDPSSLRKHMTTEHGEMTYEHAKLNKERIDICNKSKRKTKGEKKVADYGTIYSIEIGLCPDIYKNNAPRTFPTNNKEKKPRKKTSSLPDVWIYDNKDVYSIFEITPEQTLIDSYTASLHPMAPQINYTPSSNYSQMYMPNNLNTNGNALSFNYSQYRSFNQNNNDNAGGTPYNNSTSEPHNNYRSFSQNSSKNYDYYRFSRKSKQLPVNLFEEIETEDGLIHVLEQQLDQLNDVVPCTEVSAFPKNDLMSDLVEALSALINQFSEECRLGQKKFHK